ncbi:extracellular solute-binding protein [Curtobacterium flaccumfaciens]|nr:extracellular solute-binding protein [Curtobacterium flaccumfaciens]
MDDFHSSAERLAKIGSGTYAFDWVVRLWGSWTSFLYANDGNLLQEGKYSGGDWLWKSKAFADNPLGVTGRKGGWKWGDLTANSDAAVEALEYVIELQKSGASPSPDVGGGATLQGLMSSGRIGMTIGGGFWAGGLHNAGMRNGSFDVVEFPTWKSNKSLFGAGGYGIFNSSKQKDLAFEVIKLMVQPESFDALWPGNVTTPRAEVADDRGAVLHDGAGALVGVLRPARQLGAHLRTAVLQRPRDGPQPADHAGHLVGEREEGARRSTG